MTTAEAICRAVAMFDGWYAEKAKENGIDLTDDDAFQEFVAATPHPFPGPTEPDYPLGEDWQSANRWLTNPYDWFRQLDAETRVGYLAHLPLSYPNAADVHNSLRDWVADTEVAETATGGRTGGKLPEYSRPAKRLAVYLHNEHSDLKPSARAIAQMLLMHYNPVEGMFPGHDRLAQLTGYDKATVSRGCSALVAAKVLKVRKAYQYAKGSQTPNVYDFTATVKKAMDLK